MTRMENSSVHRSQHSSDQTTAFQFKSATIAPLNITHKPFDLAPTESSSNTSLSSAMHPVLEGNFRTLCDMVDHVLYSNSELECTPLHIDIHLQSQIGNNSGMGRYADQRSPLFVLSPKTLTLAKTDISMVDDAVVSQLNKETLLNLFPTPPQASPKTKTAPSIATTEATSSMVGPDSSYSRPHEACEKPHTRKSSKNRNWVITSGLFVTPPTEDGQDSYLSSMPGVQCLGDATFGWDMWDMLKSDRSSCQLLSPRHPLSPCTPLSVPVEPLTARRGQGQIRSLQSTAMSSLSLSVPDMWPVSPSMSSPSSLSSPVSPVAHMDALSQRLFNIETQMRRPSFLMNRRTSALSDLFVPSTLSPVADKHDQQERLLAELSLTIGTIAPSSEVTTFLTEPQVCDPTCTEDAMDQMIDWRAWHGAWTRRRVRPDSEATLSPISTASYTSYSTYDSERSSTDNSTACSSPTTPMHPTRLSQDPITAPFRKPRKFFSSPSTPTILATSPMASAMSASPKDANPELWGSEGLKWGDRFQSLVHNFQSTAGKHSKRLVDILPMNRWSKRSRPRSRSSPESGNITTDAS